MPPIIEIKNQQKQILLHPRRIHRITSRILKSLKVARAELSLVFVDDRKIKALNKEFLGRAYATDVLAFDLTPGELSRSARGKSGKGGKISGEVIISVQTARRNARAFQTSPDEEIILYIAHGILHLLGYDDHSSADVLAMREKEAEVLRKIKIK